ncbi:substrate-binding domain-containing protein [Pontiella sulfatireligans]|uniref:Arabinose metabolism transcriptional repressor n=1 Tax=Pontiella sulfatireligans TaxID=2750658 RepID=A0A6C2UIG0_9BACT|nr:substrate-binding domain-containing protein [Pontiella sulfatireligans]VGO19247.1 Arabinose metabolism transcriptional repressor [Pontiella sulfatireligans]
MKEIDSSLETSLESTPHKYQGICDDILARIESGELPPGTRLPGVRALGEQYGCNYHTVRHAFETLAERGYVELKRGSGTFVTERAVDFKMRKVATEKVLRTTDKIGVLLPLKQWGYYVTSLIDQLHHMAEDMGIKLNIRTVTEIDIHSASLAREFLDQDCCAIILPWIGEDQHAAGLHDFIRASELPVVLANPAHGLEANCYWDPSVEPDASHSDTYLQCSYLRKLGYNKIALLGPDTEGAEYFQRKLLQYSRWCDREDLPNLIGMVDRSEKDYKRIIKRWAPMKGELAVIAYHDEIAFEFMSAAASKGFSIPDDFAVLGHNNNPNGLRSNPPLSTMLLPYEYVAKGMIGHALALSQGKSAQLVQHEPQAFYIRESCGGRARLGVDGVEKVVKELMDDFGKR